VDSSALNDIPMSDFLLLIEENLKMYGRDRYISMLSQNNDASSDDTEKGEVESVDYLSPSDGDDDKDSDSESDSSNNTSSLDSSEIDHNYGVNELVYVHSPRDHASLHCPPFESINSTQHGICNCTSFAMIDCCQTDGYSFFTDLDFESEHQLAADTVNDILRLPSNLKRKRLYKLVFLKCDFGILEPGERRRLPNCVVAKIRQMYPSNSGLYMGFKER
jgi:hypothetical protein